MKKIYTLLAVAALTAGAAMPAQAAWNKQYVKVMLDPGHGGEDPGAGRSGYPYEAELVLRCSMAMKGWLEGQRCPLRMTRTTNATVSLSARRSASISYDPWVFCSVHLNAFNGTAHGTETWYYWANRSPSLAQKTQSELVSRLGTTNRGVKQNGWTVITGASYIPAILTEGLFVDNVTENNMINKNDKAGFKAWVNAHLQGFKNFMNSENAGIDVDANYGAAATPPKPQKNPSITCASDLYFECYVDQHPELDLQITGKDLDNNITVTSNAGRFNLVGSSDKLGGKTSVSLGKTGGTVKVRLHDSSKACEYNTNDDNKQSWMNISITSGSVKKTVLLSCKVKPNPLQPTEKWNISEAKGNKTSKGYDASQLRNFCYKDGKIYAIYQNADIIVLNAQTGDKLGFLKRGDVVKGGTLRLCDVKTVSGKIVACNLATASSKENLRIYAWDSDNANPYLVKEIAPADFHGASRLGDCLEVTGDWNSDVWFSFGNENGKTRIIEWNKKGNNWTSQSYEVVTQYGTKQTNLSTQATVRVYHQSGGWWIDGKDSYPTWVTLNNGKAVRQTYVDTGESWGSSHHEFNFGGQKHSANIVFNGKIYKAGSETDVDPNKNYLGGRMRIVQDLTGNFTRVQNVGDYPSDKVTETYDFNGQTMTRETTVGLGLTSRNTNATGDCFVNTDGTKYLEAWVLSTTHGIAYYAHGSVPKQNPAKLELQDPEGQGTVDPKPDEPVDPTPVVSELGTLTEVWHYSTKKNNLPGWFDTANFTRSAVVLGDKVIVANCKAFGTPVINAVTADNNATVSAVNVTGITGGTFALGSVDAYKGQLYASNVATSAQAFTVYRWKNGLGQAPEVALKVANPVVPLGDNMCISNDRIGVAGTNGTTISVVWFQLNADGSINPNPNVIVTACKNLGSRSATSVVFEKDGSFWLNNKHMQPTHYSADGQKVLHTLNAGDKSFGTGGDVFEFGAHRYYVATHSLGSTASSTYGNVSTRLYDITNLDNIAGKNTYPAEGIGEDPWDAASGKPANTDVKADVSEYKPGYKRARIVTVAPTQGITLYQFEGRTSTTGVDDITADEAANDTEAVYYNLQGVRMSSDNLAPGLYIRKAGKKATKVLVK